LRLLDDKHESGKFKLLYTTDSATMRGFDYRARNHGISLVIAESFQTERDFHQAMVRVGRHGDKCKRYGVEGVDRINKELNEKLQNDMYNFLKK
jgi:hypothetical protein